MKLNRSIKIQVENPVRRLFTKLSQNSLINKSDKAKINPLINDINKIAYIGNPTIGKNKNIKKTPEKEVNIPVINPSSVFSG